MIPSKVFSMRTVPQSQWLQWNSCLFSFRIYGKIEYFKYDILVTNYSLSSYPNLFGERPGFLN